MESLREAHAPTPARSTQDGAARGLTLKGSAFFYVDVHRTLDGEHKRENYPDHCAHDPRWHVQPIAKAWHVNYHLGFRCCLSLSD